jgi:adenylate cyclase
VTFFDVKIGLFEFAFDDGSIPVYFYILTVAVIFSIFSQLKLMIGEQQFNSMIRGRFYRPREEERIFMFLDLKSSTTIAERMGHIDYSKLIQDCFNDVSVVLENEAEIYQYVGDEIVLTWESEKGLKDHNCIKAFFHYKKRLKEQEEHYMSKYGLHPEFKAGLNIGTVTVTEVGKYKKEIAYHGDPINTAARIQGLCNSLNADLLISEELKEALTENDFNFTSKGTLELKGKEERVNLYEVES